MYKHTETKNNVNNVNYYAGYNVMLRSVFAECGINLDYVVRSTLSIGPLMLIKTLNFQSCTLVNQSNKLDLYTVNYLSSGYCLTMKL